MPQRGGLSECQRLINEAYSSGLGVPEAFRSLFWIKLESTVTRITVGLFVICYVRVIETSVTVLVQNVPIYAFEI